MANLNPTQQEVLKSLVSQTMKIRGKNFGKPKGIVTRGTFHGITMKALMSRGFAKFIETDDGGGYIATEAGYNALKEV